MKISKRRLKQIIREEYNKSLKEYSMRAPDDQRLRPMTKDYVLASLQKIIQFGPRQGLGFGQLAMQHLENGNALRAADAIMDALMIDDPPIGADQELADLIMSAIDIHDLAALTAPWGTKHFRS